MMFAAVSEATWGFLGVLVANGVVLVGLFVRQGRQGRSVEQINRAVNHQPSGSPTLVERVATLEDRTEEIATETRVHRAWERNAFSALANHVGCVLPDEPEEGVSPCPRPAPPPSAPPAPSHRPPSPSSAPPP